MWANAVRVARADLGEQLEHVDHAHQQVVEVHRVHAVQIALVELVDVGDDRLEVVAHELAVVLGRTQPVLGRRDLMLDRAGGVALGVVAELVEAALDQPPRVGLVVDRERPRVAQPRRLGAQHSRARGVERHQPHRAGVAAEQQLDALAHLLRGAVGERDRQDLARPRALGADQPRDPMGEDARLAGACAGEDEQRPTGPCHRLALGRVERLKQFVELVLGGWVGHRHPAYGQPLTTRNGSRTTPERLPAASIA